MKHFGSYLSVIGYVDSLVIFFFKLSLITFKCSVLYNNYISCIVNCFNKTFFFFFRIQSRLLVKFVELVVFILTNNNELRLIGWAINIIN